MYNILKGKKECSRVCPIRDGQLVLKLLKHCQKDTIIFELLFYILCKILNSEQIPNKKLTAFIFRYLTWTLFSWLYFGTSQARRKHLKSGQAGIMSGWGAIGSQLGGLGERCKLPWRVWGGAPEANAFPPI